MTDKESEWLFRLVFCAAYPNRLVFCAAAQSFLPPLPPPPHTPPGVPFKGPRGPLKEFFVATPAATQRAFALTPRMLSGAREPGGKQWRLETLSFRSFSVLF